MRGDVYHFSVGYDSSRAGVFTVQYYATGNGTDANANGAAAAVGMQGCKCDPEMILRGSGGKGQRADRNSDTVSSSGQVMATTFSYRTTKIVSPSLLQCDSNANQCVQAVS